MFWMMFQIAAGMIAPFFIIAFLVWLFDYLKVLAEAKRLSLQVELEQARRDAPKIGYAGKRLN